MITLAYALFVLWAGAIGLALGSFWNVCIQRWPHDLSVLGSSGCPACGHRVRARDLVPVVSYVLLRGKCRDCGAAIGRDHPVVEALGGLLGMLAFRRTVPTLFDVDAVHLGAFAALMVFLGALVVAALVDVRHRIVPDQTSIYAVPVMIAMAGLLGAAGWYGWPPLALRQAVFGAALGGGFLAVMAVGSELILRKEGLGWGDVKLMAMIGGFVGALPGALVVLLLGSLIGASAGLVHLVWTGRRSYLPLGPPLAISATLWVLYGDSVILRLFPTYGMMLDR